MWRLFASATVMALLVCGPAAAQTAGFGPPPMSGFTTAVPGLGTPMPSGTPVPSFGATSSLGTVATAVPVGGSAIPLGSSQLFVGGLSPAPGDPNAQGDPIGASTVCLPVSAPGTAPDVVSSAVAIIGTAGSMVDPSQAPGCVPPAAGTSAPGGLSSTPGSANVTSTAVTTIGAPSFGGGVIPLGVSDLATTGLSPLPIVPVPTASATACSQYALSLSLSAAALGSFAPAAGTSSSTLSLPLGC